MNANFGILPALEVPAGKKERKKKYAERALTAIKEWQERLMHDTDKQAPRGTWFNLLFAIGQFTASAFRRNHQALTCYFSRLDCIMFHTFFKKGLYGPLYRISKLCAI